MDPKWVVIEHYKDGGKWTHAFWTKRDAEWNLKALTEAHRGRRYELIAADEATSRVGG